MNAPYMGDFRVSQEFKGPEKHDGLDLVGIDSKNIHCVVAGKVIFTGWENSKNKSEKVEGKLERVGELIHIYKMENAGIAFPF